MLVRDVMTEDPKTARPDTPAGEVAEMFYEHGIRHVPIVEDEVLVGIVSDRDLRSLSMPRLVDQEALADIKRHYVAQISELMSPDPIVAHPEMGLREAIDLMVEHKVGALPVVEPSDRSLQGILSYLDVLRGVRDELEE